MKFHKNNVKSISPLEGLKPCEQARFIKRI
jgi:hypothetical protein